MEGRTFTHYSRDKDRTELTYHGGIDSDSSEVFNKIVAPPEIPPSPYTLFWGEIHGHTELSDGCGTLDDYFTAARDRAGLDFCAVTDHDHGGPGRPPLFGEKWELTKAAVRRYHNPGRFVTLLGYERDSYPWYSNLCLYYRGDDAEPVRGAVDGRITRAELAALLARDDVIAIPHHPTTLTQGVNFDAIPPELMTPLIEVYSKWGASEFYGNPEPTMYEARGGHWRDALERGARMGCVGGSDIHSPHPGLRHHVPGASNIRYPNPGLVAVLAETLSREAVFDALKARRCYASSGIRVAIDFRINQAPMGSILSEAPDGQRDLYLSVEADSPLRKVTVLRNVEDRFVIHLDGTSTEAELRVTELTAERETDYYYVRVEAMDGRRAWTSPIWIGQAVR